MKTRIAIISLCLATILIGCAATPVVLAPVGPCSTKHEASHRDGHLQVFSVKEALSEGDDLIWYQHSSYIIYSPQGKRIKYVGNAAGKWDETPQTVNLPAGQYTLRARAEGYRWLFVRVPVVIEPGRTTVVHLESGWKPPESPPGVQIVRASSGYAVGWRSDSSISPTGR